MENNETKFYSNAELDEVLGGLESDLVEFKESWRGDAPEKARQAVCAFANDLPGHGRPGLLVVGVRNDGVPTGLSIDVLVYRPRSLRAVFPGARERCAMWARSGMAVVSRRRVTIRRQPEGPLRRQGLRDPGAACGGEPLQGLVAALS